MNADAGPTCEGLCKSSLCTNPNSVCVDNQCARPCTGHTDCALTEDCRTTTEDGTGKSLTTCQPNGKSDIGAACPSGTECASVMTCGDGTPCPSTGSCKTGSCQALTCIGYGVDDASAYCTMLDCHGDTDCPGGYWCKTFRTSAQICGQPTPPANICGTSTDPCVDPTQDAANGTTYAAGNVCTVRNECRVRGLCDACTTDLDCSLVPGQRCVNGGCASDCASDGDCENGLQCKSGACVPRFGSCATPTGTGKFCEPCRTDLDCGPNLFCGLLVNGGMRTCLLASAISCQTDADCPASPGGLHAQCSNLTCAETPLNATLNLATCWCQNEGAVCSAAADCCSNNCVGANAQGALGTCQ